MQGQTQGSERAGQSLELKICERCGGLWLRPVGAAWSYCRACKVQMDQLPPVRLKRARNTRRGAQ